MQHSGAHCNEGKSKSETGEEEGEREGGGKEKRNTKKDLHFVCELCRHRIHAHTDDYINIGFAYAHDRLLFMIAQHCCSSDTPTGPAVCPFYFKHNVRLFRAPRSHMCACAYTQIVLAAPLRPEELHISQARLFFFPYSRWNDCFFVFVCAIVYTLLIKAHQSSVFSPPPLLPHSCTLLSLLPSPGLEVSVNFF